MRRIDDVITTISTMTKAKRAILSTNATRVIANGPRSNFRGFQGDRLVARITRINPGKIIAQVRGVALPPPFTPLSAAQVAAAGALHARADDAIAALPRAA
jgi:hypothetical protein